jgi:MFS family permease
MPTSTFEPADHLHSRTFLGLLVAQFLAAFNDQAIHAAAMFFAINTEVMSESRAITLMPILFYAPWAIFCTLAGYFADRFSKQCSLIFWKVAEVAITLTALVGFWVGRQDSPGFGASVVLACVFLMGMHSAFFVPAKYGAMPEILTSRMLSRGNGLLESLSFLAVILGTVIGGVLSTVYRGQEYKIGLILTVLAVAGALASLLIRRMPAANPTRPFPPYVFKPLWENIRLLLGSRPLQVAVVGIAFFTFLVAFMRATVYMHGQAQVPRWTELKTSVIVGMVALGIGLGSPLVGFLSGGKVELGLVPIGAVGMMFATSVAAMALDNIPTFIVCIVLIGFFTGFYLVPLFTLLQHRAPRTSKGDSIATSNFINVTGAILASVVFYAMDVTARQTGLAPPMAQVGAEIRGVLEEKEVEKGHARKIVVDGRAFTAEEDTPPLRQLRISRRARVGDEVVGREFRAGPDVLYYRFRRADQPPVVVYNYHGLPRLLFLSAGAMTLLTLLVLWRQMPDLFVRTLLWARAQRRYQLEIAGMNHLPARGPVLLATDGPGVEGCLQVFSATDRTARFVFVPGPGEPPPPAAAVHYSLGVVGPDGGEAWEEVARKARAALGRGEVVGLSLNGACPRVANLLTELATLAPVLPVHNQIIPGRRPGSRPRVYVVAGPVLPPGATVPTLLAELARLREDLEDRMKRGLPLEHVEEGLH